MKQLLCLLLAIAGASFRISAQTCDCEKEFTHIRNFIETNYAGFKDKYNQEGKRAYNKRVADLEILTKQKGAEENCLLLINRYLDGFRDDHIQISAHFDGTKIDTGYISRRQRVELSDQELARLQQSTGIEGIYLSRFDSSYRIAVIKDKTNWSDYTGVMLSSKAPTWTRGLVKFRAVQLNDSLLKGVLFMRNQVPKVEWFGVGKNRLGGDWQREGTISENKSFNWIPVDAKSLGDKTFYIKIASFSPSNAKKIDSIFKTHADRLASTPNLVLDLRGNGGGSDFAYGPLIPYLYTNLVKSIGVDVLATPANIDGWKAILADDDIPENTKQSIRGMIAKMEANPGRLVNIVDDEIDSSYTPMAYPQKVVILIDGDCASTTEQFLLFAKQSTKVILAGQPTQGTLDYSNMRDANFVCMPYTLHYATTRSRRLDVGQGIDNVGIKPAKLLGKNEDWIKAAQQIAEGN